MKNTRIRIRIDCEMEHLEPPHNAQERAIREQTNIKLRALARNFEKPLEKMIEAILP